MSIDDDHVKRMKRVLKNLMDSDMVALDYDEPVGCMNIVDKYTREHLLSISTSEDKNPKSYSIDIESENGFDLFYDIFPTAPRININLNKITSNKFRFMEAYLLGKCCSHIFDSIESYKYFHDSTFSGEHYIFQTFDIGDPQNLGFHYYYTLDLDLNYIDAVSQIIYFNHKLTSDVEIIMNDEFDVDHLINSIIAENAAKRLNVNIDNLKLTDSQIIQMLNV